tara:strand:- start:362 stop:859 length:498 start_codon:yes stop_codon:yes gene_type:complete
MKAYSIVSIVLTCIFFIIIAALVDSLDYEGSAGWAFITGIYALVFSIIGLVWSAKKSPKNITVMVMSIIGLLIAVLTIILSIISFSETGWGKINALEGASGWGIICSIFLLPQSIVSLVQSIRHNKKNSTVAVTGVSSELEKLDDLRKKGIISDEEFETKKREIL